jgi:choline-sulfatase
MPDDSPNVLFLMSDQHSFQFVSDRFDGVQTPTLDGLRGSGTVFESAYCPVPLCTPSRMCTLSGREAQRCGAWENWLRLDPDLPTLPDAFGDAGYDTCLEGKMHLGGDHQFVGFDDRPYGDLTGMTGHQSDPPEPYWAKDDRAINYTYGETGIPESLLQERNIIEESIAWLREHDRSGDPWLLCASFSRPHGPNTAPERHLDRYPPEEVVPPETWPGGEIDHPAVEAADDREAMLASRAAYFACVDFLDEALGDFLALADRAGLLENTVVVYVSDHGDMAGEHGRGGKGIWYEDSARVPMVVQTPAQRRGDADAHTVETPVSLLDLYPTLCSLAGIETPSGLDGHDLSAAVETGAEPDRGPVVTDYLTPSFGGKEYRMVREGDYKFVHYRDEEYPDILIDLESDPRETTNLAPDADGEDREALQRFREYVADTIDFDVCEAIRHRDEEELPDHALPVGGTEFINAYHLPDGRVVDADAPLYRPHVIADDGDRVIE